MCPLLARDGLGTSRKLHGRHDVRHLSSWVLCQGRMLECRSLPMSLGRVSAKITPSRHDPFPTPSNAHQLYQLHRSSTINYSKAAMDSTQTGPGSSVPSGLPWFTTHSVTRACGLRGCSSALVQHNLFVKPSYITSCMPWSGPVHVLRCKACPSYLHAHAQEAPKQFSSTRKTSYCKPACYMQGRRRHQRWCAAGACLHCAFASHAAKAHTKPGAGQTAPRVHANKLPNRRLSSKGSRPCRAITPPRCCQSPCQPVRHPWLACQAASLMRTRFCNSCVGKHRRSGRQGGCKGQPAKTGGRAP